MSVHREMTGRRATSASDKRTTFQSRDSFKSLQHASMDELDDTMGSPRVPRKFITNWKHACDRTKDRTKELLRRWRTMPDSAGVGHQAAVKDHGWSVHVWATWVERDLSEEDCSEEKELHNCLSQTQNEKFSYFFSNLLDADKDNIISAQDFEAFSERLRHFADWSNNSTEFHVLREVQNGFIETFINSQINKSLSEDFVNEPVNGITIDQWLMKWSNLIGRSKSLYEFPLWIQYFAKIVFLVINKSGSGVIDKDELKMFYSSFLGLDSQNLEEILDIAYNNMTSNGDHPLCYPVYNLCFANFLLGRYPHGPGQFIFGTFEGVTKYSSMFPVDYSALNSPPEKLEQYSPHKKSNRHSVVV